TVRDANGATSDATVSLDIISINDVPTVDLNGGLAGTGHDVTFIENGAGVTIVSPDVTLSDDDDTALVSAQVVLTNGNDGDVLDVAALPAGITALVSPSGGLSGPGTITVTLSGTGILADYETALQAITYRSTSDNPDTTQRLIEVTVNDGEDASVIALSRVTVTAVNDAPIAADDGTPAPLAVLEDTPFIFDPVTSNDIDLEGDVLTITAIDGMTITAGGFVTLASGRVDLDSDGVTLTFNPTPNSFGPVSFTYTVSDGALSDMATINIDVVSVNDAPIAVDDGPVVLLEDDVAYFDPVLANDSDVEGQALSIVAIDGQSISAGVSVFVTNGQITLGVDNRTLEFVPDPDYFGQTTITYSVSDGIDQSDATVTFDVTGVDDVIVNTGAPANQTFEDGQIVSLGMAAFFADPDNDPILYSGSGLPGGLTIDSGTGLISGQLDSDASLGGTYTVLVEANDRNNPTVSTTFDITVTNTVPVAGGNIVTSVIDGDAVFIDTSAQFVDADGDTLTYSTTALPTWLTFDSGTGILSGVAPADASVSGPIAIIVTADDGEGGSDQFSLTLTPQNAVPVVLGSAPDLLVSDGDIVTFDVAAHFADGVPDNDALTLSVTGLPAGVTFDALTGQISGVVSSQSGGSGSFTVVMTADDGQGGVVSDGFTITVGGDDAVEAPNLFANFLDLVDDDDTGSKEESGQTGLTVSDAAEISGGTVTLEEGEDVVQAVVNSIEPLRSGTDELDGFIDVTGFGVRDGEGQFLFPDGTSLLDFDNGSFLDVEPGSSMLDAVTVSATARSGLLLIELNDRAGDTMRVAQVRLAVSGMEQWPSWMTMLRDKLVSVRPPVGLETLDLTMAIVFEDGQSVLKMVRVNVETGAIENVEKPAKESEDVTSPPDEATPDLTGNQDGKTVAENAGQVEGLRASLTD
ncbi:MAG: putative Ig domain-containing protein, partial [Pseudomonadota bacterium]